MKVLVTGSSGLIGSEAVLHFDRLGWDVVGVDNNMRQVFFGPEGDTAWNLRRLERSAHRFRHVGLDVRDREGIFGLFRESRFDAVIHCAAQPSHDKAAQIPLVDFEVNALGTLNLLEATRQHCPEAPFVFMSTNKVYGDTPNRIPLIELDTRYDYARPEDHEGIDESCSIDQSLHSIFGASKVAADVMAQEYGRYYGLSVGIFRGGCLTGPAHSGVQLHGFLSYLVRVAVRDEPYTIFGYKGKQVRDQIHSSDVVRAFEQFIASPRQGEVYNIGGGRHNSASVLEAISMIEQRIGRSVRYSFDEQNRRGDHICYITNLAKLRSDFPEWDLEYSLDGILDEMVEAELARSDCGG